MTEMSISGTPSVSSRRLWWAAIKLPMYTVAVIPITVGTAVAYGHTHQLQGGRFGLFLGAAIAIVAWLNLSNDVFDSDTGIDVNKAHSVVNLTGNRGAVLAVANGLLALGLGGIGALTWLQGDGTVLGLIALAVFLGYTYQGPPFRLGYQGLGEILCFITFGPLAIAAAAYAQTQTWFTGMIWPSLLIGLSTAIILFCSHFHQVADDLAAGKRSPIVRLGTQRGAWTLAIAVGAWYTLVLGGIALGVMPLSSLLVLASLPWGGQLVRHVLRYHDQPERVNNCKFIAVNFHFISGLLLAIAYGVSG